MLNLSNSFDRELFLREYWQKKPLLIRGFFEGFTDLLSAEEVAGLACESFVESRLVEGSVTQNPSDNSIAAELALSHGPIDEERFPSLPQQDWTVLVQSVDQWVPEVAELKAVFDFIPSWRLEDVMVSFAAPGGTVGPHFDHYDVFLLQGSGSRNWRVGERCTAETNTVDQAGLSLLPEFAATDSYDLEPGDVLYLPPRYAHWGTATDAGLCYSIGLRSPSLAEMLEGYSDALIARADPASRYEDSAPQVPEHPGEIKSTMLDTAYQSLMDTLGQREAFNRWFGCQVTQPRYPELIHAPDEDYTLDSLVAALESGAELLRHPGSRFANMSEPDGTVLCFVDGGCIELSESEATLVSLLSNSDYANYGEIFQQNQSPAGREFLLQLVNQGSLVVELP